MIWLLATAAFGGAPPRGELFAGWAGNASQSFGMLVAQPALVRARDASLSFRASVSQLHYSYAVDGMEADVSGPGISLGPAFAYQPGAFSLGFSVGVGGRSSTLRTDLGLAERSAFLEATFSGDAAWRPARASVYSLFSLNAGARYLWARAGATHSVLSYVAPGSPVDVWLGVEATSSGPFRGRTLEVGPVLEVPIRDLAASVSLRGGVALRRGPGTTGIADPTASVGLGVYWSY